MNKNGNQIMKPLNDQMRCGIFINQYSHMLIVHDCPLLFPIQWIEYDDKDCLLFIVYENGCIQDLGLNIAKEINKSISTGIDITIYHINDNKIQSSQNVPFIIGLGT